MAQCHSLKEVCSLSILPLLLSPGNHWVRQEEWSSVFWDGECAALSQQDAGRGSAGTAFVMPMWVREALPWLCPQKEHLTASYTRPTAGLRSNPLNDRLFSRSTYPQSKPKKEILQISNDESIGNAKKVRLLQLTIISQYMNLVTIKHYAGNTEGCAMPTMGLIRRLWSSEHLSKACLMLTYSQVTWHPHIQTVQCI